MAEYVNMPEYVWTYEDTQGSEYVSYNIERKFTQQVNKYLLKDERIQNPVKDLRKCTLEKIIMAFNYFCKFLIFEKILNLCQVLNMSGF